MRVELSGGRHAIIRDQMMRGDRRRASKEFVINFLPDGTRVVPGDSVENVIGALLREMIVDWDVGQPVPRTAQSPGLGDAIIDSLDDRDVDRLRDAVQPFVNRVLRNEGDPRAKALEQLATEFPDRFAELLAAARGEQENGAGGPKRVLTSTVISTSDAPGPPGRPTPTG